MAYEPHPFTLERMASEAENGREKQAFFVTRESQKNHKPMDKKLSYVGMRDVTQVDKIEEEDIVGPDGELRGIKNRVRAGLVNFQDVDALTRVSVTVTRRAAVSMLT